MIICIINYEIKQMGSFANGSFNIHEYNGSAFSPGFPTARPLINDHFYKWNISLSDTIFFFAKS